MVIFGIIGTKGGVGKTTLSANIGALIADMGLRVLLVDADIQASLSKYYELNYQAPKGLTDVIHSGAISEACISHSVWERLDIVLCDTPRRRLCTKKRPPTAPRCIACARCPRSKPCTNWCGNSFRTLTASMPVARSSKGTTAKESVALARRSSQLPDPTHR